MLGSRKLALEKGFGALPLDATKDSALGLNLLREELNLPLAVLRADRLDNNARWMRDFIAAYGCRLAPHGKTTMAPRLFALQLEHGAWGITLATAQQAAVAHAHGVRRVLLADQLVGRANIEMMARLVAAGEFEFFCLVDSPDGVRLLGEGFARHGAVANVLLELGVPGGRAGVRTPEQTAAVVAALEPWRTHVQLCGVELYEGVLRDESEIRALLRRAAALLRELQQSGAIGRRPAILSGAGSAWYDVVAEEFEASVFEAEVELVLRPGCYLSHDVGIYREAQARIASSNPIARRMHGELQPALEVWAYVQSIPEPDRAIVAMGKRDAAFDAGLPTPAWYYRPGSEAPTTAPAHWQLSKMMDQHAYLTIAPGDAIAVGDMIGFDISHPCLTFDKWRLIPLVDAGYTVVDVAETFF